MEFHLISSQQPLEAFETWIQERNETTEAQLIYLHDELDIGPLSDPETSFNELRNNFWDHLAEHQIARPPHFDDLQKILKLLRIAQEQEDCEVYYWLQGESFFWINYYWVLHWLHPIKDQFKVINAVGLPFLNEEKSLIFPKNWDGIPSSELNKTLGLARNLSDPEWEMEQEEFKNILQNQHFVRLCTPLGKVTFEPLMQQKEKVLKEANMANFSNLSNPKKRTFLDNLNTPLNRKLIRLWIQEEMGKK